MNSFQAHNPIRNILKHLTRGLALCVALAFVPATYAAAFSNGGFESPGTEGGSPTGWTADFNSYGTFNGAAQSGSWGLHPGAGADSGGRYQDFETVIGTTYLVSAWAQNFDSAEGSSHLDVLIGTPGDGSHTFTFPNYNTEHTTTKFASDVTDNSFLVGGTWQQFTFSFTATGTTTRIGLYNSYKAGDTVHSINVDDVSVASSYFQITNVDRDPGTGEVTLRFTSIGAAFYTVWGSTDLVNWQDIDDNVDGQAGETSYTDTTFEPAPAPAGKNRVFYRVTRNP